MANYDVVSGFDLATLNSLSGQIYEALYPEFFSDTIVINNEFIYSVTYDAKKPLVFDFNPSKEARQFLKDNACRQAEVELKSALEEYIETDVITIGAVIPELNLGLKKVKDSTPIQFPVSFKAGASIDVTENNEVIIRLLTAGIKIPGEPVFEDIVNQFVIPVLIEKINDFLAKGFKIPPFDFGFISFSTPVPAIQNNTLVAFAALSSKGASVPPDTGNWPANRVFGFFDNDVADIVIEHFVKDLQKAGEAKSSTNIGICDLKLDAKYSVGLRNPSFKAESGNVASVGIEAYGGGSASLKCGFIHPSVGVGITASPDVKAGVVVDKNNKLNIVFKSVNDFKVGIDIKNLPSILKKALDFIVNAIAGPVVKLIGSLLSGLTIPVYTIPEIPVTIKEKSVVITLDNLEVDTFTEQGGGKYVGAEGSVLVKPGSK